MSTEPIDRPSSRVILIGPDGRTLLMRGGDPVRRELWKETGLVDVEWEAVVARGGARCRS